MNAKYLVIWLLLAVTFTNVKPANALETNDTETAQVTVEITTITMVDITPASLRWTGLEPGSVGGPSDEQEGGYSAIQIENIGSHNITHIWFNNTFSTGREVGTGTNASIDSANFVVLAKDGSSDFYFAGRKEWNESRQLVYLRDPNDNMPPSGYSYGRFRNSSYEYFWMIQITDDCVGGTFMIGNNPHTETQTGSTDFSPDGDSKTDVTLAYAEDGWCYGDIGGTGPLANDYTVYVKNQTFDEVIFYHWNKDIAAGSNVKYFWDSATDGNLVPGNSTVAQIRVYIPYGIYEGSLSQGTLTVIVNDL